MLVAAAGCASHSHPTATGVSGPAPSTATVVRTPKPRRPARRNVPVPRPPRLEPLVTSPPAGDGRWRAADRWAGAPTPVFTATLRFGADPAETAYYAWLRAARTRLALYPGIVGPGVTTLPRGPLEVPPSARGRLLATFNSGFYEKDVAAGFFTNGFLYFPLLRGLATVVAYRDGRVGIVRWSGGPRPGHDIVMARQNLPPLVWDGRPGPTVDTSFRWGLTLHGVPAVWRSALGIDRSGNLIYLAAPDQTAPTLARLLIHAGAVRGLELDINPEWPIFVTYGGRFAADPTPAVQNPNQIPNRFLYPSTKDFFAVYLAGG